MKKTILITILFAICIVSCKKENEFNPDPTQNTVPPTTSDPKIKAIYDTLNSKQWAGTNTANNRHLVLNFTNKGEITGNVERNDNADIFYDKCAGHYAVTTDSNIIGKYLVTGFTDSININAKLRFYGTNNTDIKIEGSLNTTMTIGLVPNQLKDFVGIWSGTYTGTFIGTYYILFCNDKTMRIIATANTGNRQIYATAYNLDGNMFNCSYANSTANLKGQLNANTITGTWSSNGSNNPGDTFTLNKQP